MAGTISDDFSELLYVLTLWLAVYSRQKVLEPLKQKSNRATRHRHLDLVLVLSAYRAFCIIGEHLNSSFPIPAIVIEICLCFTMAYLTPIVVCSKVTKPETK